MATRYLTLADVAEMLSISVGQVRTMVRTGELPAFQVGGRHFWRVDEADFETYVAEQKARARERIETDPELTVDDE
ncbi:helix-turn-helix domain-containing protein [Cellulomonas composti]|uniref:Helix-turn-helix domain-containing protein n=1 Tax=Cellulomonas composti TaxID=266130 RepID=A0A511JAW1_9CELL|nr:helix-turn-helix domain-containing protein [Cellulomonas composti]GEL95127.1 hypothetical protein CCO02nite_17850 [Cellulomonas composti]